MKIKVYCRADKTSNIQKLINNGSKYDKYQIFFVSLPPIINNFIMSNSRTITIKNPSRKLEEKIREAGVQKYLWLKELCSEETKPNKVSQEG